MNGRIDHRDTSDRQCVATDNLRLIKITWKMLRLMLRGNFQQKSFGRFLFPSGKLQKLQIGLWAIKAVQQIWRQW